MAGIYVDTSALGRVLLAEPDASVILDVLIDHDEWWSSELIVVELRRLGAREGLADAAERLLGALRLAPVDSPSLQRASAIEPWAVRSLDAIHLQAAVRLKDRASSPLFSPTTTSFKLAAPTTAWPYTHRAPTEPGPHSSTASRRGICSWRAGESGWPRRWSARAPRRARSSTATKRSRSLIESCTRCAAGAGPSADCARSRAVLDPNVLVAALISPGGPPRAIIVAWTEDRFELVVSTALLGELRDVLSRSKFQRWVNADTATMFVDGLHEDAAIVVMADDSPSVQVLDAGVVAQDRHTSV